MRTALLVPDPPSSWTPPIHDALRAEFSADLFPLRAREQPPDLAGYDLIISRLKFRHLAAMERLDWAGARAFKVHWDEDGFWDGLWPDPRYRGFWSENFPRLGFDLLAVTGMRALEYFRDRGLPTALVHKGFPAATFHDAGGERDPVMVSYGQEYLSRVLASERLRRAGVPHRRVDVPFAQLPLALNSSLAALSCTLAGYVKGGLVPERLARRFPRRFIRTGPGPEPMLKFFESAASGCAVFTDFSPDLPDLGFVDGINMVSFGDVDELVEKALLYLDDPGALREIGARSATLCAERHTWDVRARELRTSIQRRLGA